jgi:uncharacterized protein (TIGR00255 family)
MTRSMTGFGKAALDFNGDHVSVEVTSVNHRFLDFNLRLPSAWSAVDPVLRDSVKKRMARGKLNINFNRKRGVTSQHNVQFDAALARQYIEASRELASMLGSDEQLGLNVLAQMEGVFLQEDSDEDLEAVRDMLLELLHAALDQLDAMREAEGRALHNELMERIDLMRGLLAGIELRLPALREQYEEKLRARINELNAEPSVTEDRLALELAIMAEKGDVTEEIVRLKSHFDHFADMLRSDKPVGRQLDFLTQEFQREVNTLGVKARDTELTRDMLRMKGEVEKIREQVQNVE